MDTLALILAIVGAVNWGLVGFARFDLVAWIFGGQTASVSRIVYAVVGLERHMQGRGRRLTDVSQGR